MQGGVNFFFAEFFFSEGVGQQVGWEQWWVVCSRRKLRLHQPFCNCAFAMQRVMWFSPLSEGFPFFFGFAVAMEETVG